MHRPANVRAVYQYLIAAAFVAVLSSPASAQRQVLGTWTRSFLAVDTPLVALTHVTVIDGTGAPARDDQTIVLRDGRIEAVGASARVAIPARAMVLDLRGHTVIPGLVGLHEHTYLGGISRPSPMTQSDGLGRGMAVITGPTYRVAVVRIPREAVLV